MQIDNDALNDQCWVLIQLYHRPPQYKKVTLEKMGEFILQATYDGLLTRGEAAKLRIFCNGLDWALEVTPTFD